MRKVAVICVRLCIMPFVLCAFLAIILSLAVEDGIRKIWG